jgi:hypothetical protein
MMLMMDATPIVTRGAADFDLDTGIQTLARRASEGVVVAVPRWRVGLV